MELVNCLTSWSQFQNAHYLALKSYLSGQEGKTTWETLEIQIHGI